MVQSALCNASMRDWVTYVSFAVWLLIQSASVPRNSSQTQERSSRNGEIGSKHHHEGWLVKNEVDGSGMNMTQIGAQIPEMVVKTHILRRIQILIRTGEEIRNVIIRVRIQLV